MKKITLISLILLFWQINIFAQKNTFNGILEYEVTIRIDVENIRASNPDAAANIPDVFNYTEKMSVNGDFGKLERIINFPMRTGNQQQNQQAQNMMRRFIPETYWNFAENKVYTVSSLPKDSVNVDKFMIEKSVTFTTDIKEDKKTKKILGYNCKKATLKTKDDTFTIWYTTEMGFTYSPMSQSNSTMMRFGNRGGGANASRPPMPIIVIEKGVILAIEGTDIGFEAKKITTETINPETLKIPTDAKKVTEEELREMMQKRRNNFRTNGGSGRN
jgi:GLPGLI family protein